MIDSHAHHKDLSFKNAFVCTASIPSLVEAEALKTYRFHGVGHIPQSGKLDNIDLVESYLKSGFHLGEVGLDKRFDSIEDQETDLNTLLDIAIPLKRVVVFHSVGHIDRLINIIKDRKLDRFLLHGFTGSYESAKRILGLGGLISINERLEKTKSFEKVITLPFVTESDMETGEEAYASLKSWNAKLSSILGVDVESESERILLEYMNG